MSALWFCNVLLAGWWYASGEIVSPPGEGSLGWLAAGWFAALLARGKERAASPDSTGVVLIAVPAALFAAVFGAHTGVPALAWLAGLAAFLLTIRLPRLRFVAQAMASSAAVLTFQGACALLYWLVGPYVRELPSLAGPVAGALRLLGLDAGHRDGIVTVAHQEDLLQFTPSADHLGAFPALLIVAGAVPLAWMHARRRGRALAAVALVVLAYALLRYLALLGGFRLMSDATLFWRATPVVLSFVPLAGALAALVRLDAPDASALPARGLVPPRALALRHVLVPALACAAIAFALGYREAGDEKPGRVLIDEFHSDWEWTDEPFDTETYGLRTSYTFYDLYRHLDRHFEVERCYEALTEERLRSCDVLLLKTPTAPLAAAEVGAVVAFVERGGGLWLIGDHTNVFGTATHLNPVAERFGLRFGHDCAYEIATGSLNVYVPPRHFAHPIAAHLPPFMFATPCTLRASAPVDSVMTASGLSVLPADYGQPNFFPRPEPRRDFLFGPFLLAATREYGRGRVAAFTDSTVFSNFFMFLPGKAELALATVDWLNRSNRTPWLRPLAASAGLVLLLASVLALRRAGSGWAVAALSSGAFAGFAAVAPITDALVARAYPLPEPREPLPTIRFDLEHSEIFLPIVRLQGEGDNDYATFFTWTQRIGYVPAACATLEEALSAPGVVVVADPRREPSPDEHAALRDHVEGGGTLLLLDRGTSTSGTGSAFLRPFGMSLGASLSGEVPLAAPFEGLSADGGCTVEGGEPLLATASGRPVAAWRHVGRGRVVAAGISNLFSAKSMGTVSTKPDARQLALYDLEYALLRLAAGEVEPPLTRGAIAGVLPPSDG